MTPHMTMDILDPRPHVIHNDNSCFGHAFVHCFGFDVGDPRPGSQHFLPIAPGAVYQIFWKVSSGTLREIADSIY